MFQLRSARPEDVPFLVDVWRRSVRATHFFLSEGDLHEIENAVATMYLPNALDQMTVAMDADSGKLVGFMGLTGHHIDSLFLDPVCRGHGLGRQFIDHAAACVAVGGTGTSCLSVDVNEQNDQAVGFYRHLGFSVTGRSPTDDDGRPYPILHMHRP